MQDFPYLFGQLLKVSDALHAMYCKIMRDGNVPSQLAGSSMYIAGSEQPYRTLGQLGLRMNPYISWARSYRAKNQEKDGSLVGWYLYLYEQIATKLNLAWSPKTRLSEDEKAAYFIGYLAAFPKKDDLNQHDNTENGGIKK